ncbi:MAG: hypothetical protein ISS58_09090 [Dehalococcoidales bacterium]|nr:hypothetical protein [Dehalococcoidales bacterium]
MSTQGDAYSLEVNRVALLIDDMPAGYSLSKRFFDSLRYSLDSFACSEYVDTLDLRQVIDCLSRMRVSFRLELFASDSKFITFQMDKLSGIVVRVCRLQTCLQYLKHGLPYRHISMRHKTLSVLYP